MIDDVAEPTSEEAMRARVRELREKTYPTKRLILTPPALPPPVKNVVLATVAKVAPDAEDQAVADEVLGAVSSRLGMTIEEMQFGRDTISSRGRLVTLSLLTHRYNMRTVKAARAVGCASICVSQARSHFDEWIKRNATQIYGPLAPVVDEFLAEAERLKIGDVTQASVTLSDIRKAVTAAFGIASFDIDSACRTARVVAARHAAYKMARDMTSASFQQIADFIGRRDHTTVVHGAEKVNRLLPDLKFTPQDSPWEAALTLARLIPIAEKKRGSTALGIGPSITLAVTVKGRQT